MKPAPDRALAAEVAKLAGGAKKLAERARALSTAGEMRLACHLAEMAVQAAPYDPDAHAARRDVYRARREGELSQMAKGIFGAAAEKLVEVLGGGDA